MLSHFVACFSVDETKTNPCTGVVFNCKSGDGWLAGSDGLARQFIRLVVTGTESEEKREYRSTKEFELRDESYWSSTRYGSRGVKTVDRSAAGRPVVRYLGKPDIRNVRRKLYRAT